MWMARCFNAGAPEGTKIGPTYKFFDEKSIGDLAQAMRTGDRKAVEETLYQLLENDPNPAKGTGNKTFVTAPGSEDKDDPKEIMFDNLFTKSNILLYKKFDSPVFIATGTESLGSQIKDAGNNLHTAYVNEVWPVYKGKVNWKESDLIKQ
jgi:hypothetical protein